MNDAELRVKTGDRVFYRFFGLNDKFEKITTVESISPDGVIQIKDMRSRFDKYGNEIDTYAWWSGHGTLSIPTEEDYKRTAQNSVIFRALSMIRNLDAQTLPYDKALKIIEIFGGEYMNKIDVKALYDAFVSLCDYVELDTGEGCKGCPHNKICFNADKGIEFTESLKRIKNEIDEGRMESKK